jgi:hypothetical protein
MCAKSSSTNSYSEYCYSSNLGNYTNIQDNQTTQKSKNRENLLKTLIKGSHIPNDVKKCSELISTCNKKGIKTKSED